MFSFYLLFFIAVVVGEEKEERTNVFMKSIPFTSEVSTAAVGTTNYRYSDYDCKMATIRIIELVYISQTSQYIACDTICVVSVHILRSQTPAASVSLFLVLISCFSFFLFVVEIVLILS